MGPPDSFTDFVTEQGRGLLRAAWLLTGDWAASEDLVQTTPATTRVPRRQSAAPSRCGSTSR